jgi:cob(I)alamin adenosyltransferase
VCRRAERLAVELASQEDINANVVIYLNRLSDYFFAAARYVNHLSGVKDIIWKGK